MDQIRLAEMPDKAWWLSLDKHLAETEFDRKVRDRQAYLCLRDGAPVGLLRYTLFWDNTPFCTLLYVDERCRGQGVGSLLLARWEEDLRAQGYGLALTSTQVDETAQFFYRKAGYQDCGCLVIDVPGYAQPMEMFLRKAL